MDTDPLYDAIRSNYNEIGAAVIQQLFGEGYLSPRGETATDCLADLAGPTESTRMLDVGSGLGGAAMRLAGTYGCSVTGLELLESNLQTATKTVEARGLTHLIRFQLGDATVMPFADDAFSMVWGQDAWCHVPDRNAVIGECARVLEPGGTIAFADWLLTAARTRPIDATCFRPLPARACIRWTAIPIFSSTTASSTSRRKTSAPIMKSIIKRRWQDWKMQMTGSPLGLAPRFSPSSPRKTALPLKRSRSGRSGAVSF